MAALWDVTTGTFFPEQDWVHDAKEDGTRPSCWEAATMKEAEICVTGLMNMQSFYAAQMARSPESSVPWDDAFHFRMAVMLQWCKRVVDGRMPHGALLAHTRLTGQEVREAKDCILPAAGVDWQQHGREGVAAVKSILLNLGFYPRTVMPIEGRRPPAVASQRDRNTATKEQGLPSVLWNNLQLIRGVELWLEDPMMLEEYTWAMLQGGPTVAELQSPVSSGALRPGEYNITFYQQVKGHWFWAMYRDEAQNQLIVKWVRGRCPPGGKRLGCEKKNSHMHHYHSGQVKRISINNKLQCHSKREMRPDRTKSPTRSKNVCKNRNKQHQQQYQKATSPITTTTTAAGGGWTTLPMSLWA